MHKPDVIGSIPSDCGRFSFCILPYNPFSFVASICCLFSIEDLKEIFLVKYSEKQPQRAAEEHAWIHFADFMDEYAGITSKYKIERNALHQFLLLSTMSL